MRALIYLIIAAVLAGGGYYLGFIYSPVSAADTELCEQTYRESYAQSPEILEKLLPGCKQENTLVAMQANAEQVTAQEASERIAAANRSALLRTVLAFAMIGGGIGALVAAIKPKKKMA